MTQKRFHRFHHRNGSSPEHMLDDAFVTARPSGSNSAVADLSPILWAKERMRIVCIERIHLLFFGRMFAGVATLDDEGHFKIDLCPWFEAQVKA